MKKWNIKKQNYWILRRGNPWKIMSNKTNKSIANYPKGYYNDELIENICFAKTDKEIENILKKHNLN